MYRGSHGGKHRGAHLDFIDEHGSLIRR
jgi:hypothetical protein